MIKTIMIKEISLNEIILFMEVLSDKKQIIDT